MLHLAGSLKLGPVQAMSVMRTIQIGDKPTKFAQAVAERGRIDKTIHALTFIDDENKRRRTLTQLKRGEERHKLGRAVFQGKRGELRQLYREGQTSTECKRPRLYSISPRRVSYSIGSHQHETF
jgi:TnpA family transposase